MGKLLYLSLLLLLALKAGAVTYYVNPAGNDANSGTSKASAWQTIDKVNKSSFNPGDSILFSGGQSFSGALSFTSASWTGASASNPVIISHYGRGRAIIRSGSLIGFKAQNIAGFILRGINFIGSGISANTADGINADNNLPDNIKLDYLLIDSVDVSGYGGNGIAITSNSGTSGFSHVSVINSAVHDCTGGTTPGTGTSGILVQSPKFGYGLGATSPCFTNVLIDHCNAYNNTGKKGDKNWTGSGIFIGQTDTGIIQHCVAKNNGANAIGTVGIWCADAINIIIQFNESSFTKTAGSLDGDGFDIDGGVKNSIMQYNYSHNNMGSGLQVYTYNDNVVSSIDSVIVRYNISVNDGPNGSRYYGNVMLGNDGGSLTRIYVYNNTLYQSGANAGAVNIGFEGSSANAITGLIANNICYSAPGTNFIFSGVTPVIKITGNDYYTTGSPSFIWNGTTYKSLTAWQAASGKEKINGAGVGKTLNPMMVLTSAAGANNYKLKITSQVLSAGLNLQLLYGLDMGTQDYFGNSISNSADSFSIGAHQPIKFTGKKINK